MTSNQPLPTIGAVVAFIAPQDGEIFTGRVFKSYGWAVAVASLDKSLPVSVLEAGMPYTVVGTD